MKNVSKLIVVLLALTALACAQKRDPLTDAEADQLRDVRMEPFKRLKMYIKFTDARLESIDQLRSDPKQAKGRPAKIHNLLEDFSNLVDEINNNLDMYEREAMDKDERKDYRKGVKEVVAACGRWNNTLRALRNAIQMDPQMKAESKAYAFVLQDAEETVKSTLEDATGRTDEKSPDNGEKK
jgi:predicted transcriptional regulator